MLPEYFPDQALGAITNYGTAQLFRGGNSQARLGVPTGQHEYGHQAPVQPRAGVVHLLKLRTPADMATGAKTMIHGTAAGGDSDGPRLPGR